jgi:hypothetical protein
VFVLQKGCPQVLSAPSLLISYPIPGIGDGLIIVVLRKEYIMPTVTLT